MNYFSTPAASLAGLDCIWERLNLPPLVAFYYTSTIANSSPFPV